MVLIYSVILVYIVWKDYLKNPIYYNLLEAKLTSSNVLFLFSNRAKTYSFKKI